MSEQDAVTEEQRANFETWQLLALIHGFNTLAFKAERLDEKVWFRLARDAFVEDYTRRGGKIERSDLGVETFVLQVGPPRVAFTSHDWELMRKALAEHDAEADPC